MKAFILAAGFGTRLMPLTATIPKPLVPVLNVPGLAYALFLLKEAGISQVIINIHHHPDSIRAFVDSHDFGSLDIVLSEETTILGTGGGLKKCEPLLDDDHFLLINSDIISDIDLSSLITLHLEGGRDGTLALYQTPDAAHIGHVGVQDGCILDFRNMRNTRLASQLIYTGVAVLGPNIFRYLSKEVSGIVDTGFTGLIDHGGLGYYRHTGLWKDIGTLRNFYLANLDDHLPILDLAERMMRQIGSCPRMIAEEASISPDAVVSNAVIGKGCFIGSGSVIEHSVIMPGVSVPEGSLIRNSIAGSGGVISF